MHGPPHGFSFVAEILTIGSELTTGRIVNANAAYLAKELTDLGFYVGFQTSVPDERALIRKALKSANQRAGTVIICGGLGPTDDDMTTDVITDFFGSKPVRSAEAIHALSTRLNERRRVLTVAALKMTKIPYGAKILHNFNGMACGYYISYNKSLWIVTPGVPSEMRLMFERGILPLLRARFKGRPIRVARILRIYGLAEARVNEAVLRSKVKERFPELVIGYQVPLPEVQVILELRTLNEKAHAVRVLDEAEGMLRQVLGDVVFGVDADTLSYGVHRQLQGKNATLALAESCTGGLLAAVLTEQEGSSAYFLGAVVCYSNDSKVRELEVPREFLDREGAVSRACAEAMAIGVRKRFGSEIGLSITGIAGPSGGSPEKPVGTVWIGLATADRVQTFAHQFHGDRQEVRTATLYAALNHLRLYLNSFRKISKTAGVR